MRIQKKFQGTVPENKILNTSSISETDTYSCKKINELVTSSNEIPVASTDTLGGIKVGNNLTIDESGKLHANISVDGSVLAVDMIYPIGSIYMSVNQVSPAVLFGGTWEQIKDKFLLGAGDTFEGGSTGGSVTHNHTLNNAWAHFNSSSKVIYYQYKRATSWKANYQVTATSASEASTSYADVTTLGGTSDDASNLPPYLVVYMWKRVA